MPSLNQNPLQSFLCNVALSQACSQVRSSQPPSKIMFNIEPPSKIMTKKLTFTKSMATCVSSSTDAKAFTFCFQLVLSWGLWISQGGACMEEAVGGSGMWKSWDLWEVECWKWVGIGKIPSDEINVDMVLPVTASLHHPSLLVPSNCLAAGSSMEDKEDTADGFSLGGGSGCGACRADDGNNIARDEVGESGTNREWGPWEWETIERERRKIFFDDSERRKMEVHVFERSEESRREKEEVVQHTHVMWPVETNKLCDLSRM